MLDQRNAWSWTVTPSNSKGAVETSPFGTDERTRQKVKMGQTSRVADSIGESERFASVLGTRHRTGYP